MITTNASQPISSDNEISQCVICGIKITQENDSKEHIIIEAIGGRRKVSKFICNFCNNETGRTWDAELAKQLLPLSHIFDIKRQRGNTPDLPI